MHIQICSGVPAAIKEHPHDGLWELSKKSEREMSRSERLRTLEPLNQVESTANIVEYPYENPIVAYYILVFSLSLIGLTFLPVPKSSFLAHFIKLLTFLLGS